MYSIKSINKSRNFSESTVEFNGVPKGLVSQYDKEDHRETERAETGSLSAGLVSIFIVAILLMASGFQNKRALETIPVIEDGKSQFRTRR